MQEALRSEKKVRHLIDISSIHYNPTGPGDYTLPSTFGELPPPRHREKAVLAGNVVRKPPSYTIGVPINDPRVYRNNLQSLHGVNAPPLGSYDPIDPKNSSFEDKARLKLLRAQRFSPYF